ncbi:MAG: hypothetical protein ACRDDY_03390 [Clostridium sp.]|uniref:hypothetical protein n=1 Tax=Clostridium sp. TaxID=1506 RepID=UPI003EE567C7
MKNIKCLLGFHKNLEYIGIGKRQSSYSIWMSDIYIMYLCPRCEKIIYQLESKDVYKSTIPSTSEVLQDWYIKKYGRKNKLEMME